MSSNFSNICELLKLLQTTPDQLCSIILSGKNGNEVVLEEEKYLLVRESEISMVSTN